MEETPPASPEDEQPAPGADTTPPAPPPPPPSSMPPPPPPSAGPPPPPGATPPPLPGSQQFTAPAGGYTTGDTAKNPVLSLILSLVVPGLGQIINGETTKGIVLIVAIVVAYITCFFLIGILLVPAVMAYAAYDAFQGAKKWNVAHGFPPGA